jgi:2-methylcitrate dehydratase PrpD
MGEIEIISGKELITAIVAGYDVMLRIGIAARAMISRAFHSTPAAGTFGAAAAAGKVMGFDIPNMINALAIAADQSCGTSEFSNAGGSVKRLHAGFPAQGGVRAALLAQHGITGPATTIEGKRGFCQAFAGEFDLNEITNGLGKDYKIMLTGNKPYCCCAAQHSVIDATTKIAEKNVIKPGDVAEIIVEQRPREVGAVGSIIETPDVVSAQFSGRFGVALRLVKGGNRYQDYVEENLKNPAITELVKKIRYVADEKHEKLKVEGGPAIVTIKLKNGASYQEQVDYAKGTRENPMLWPELEEKFRVLAGEAISRQQTEDIIQSVKILEDLDNIQKLTSLLITG